VLDAAQQAALRAGDEFVAQDRLLVALAADPGAAGAALKAAGAGDVWGLTLARAQPALLQPPDLPAI